MGFREYGVLIRNCSDLRRLKTLVKAHNNDDDDTGSEGLDWGPALIYKGQVYVCLHSGGGNASDWINNYMNEKGLSLQFFMPWEKPDWWHDTEALSPEELRATDKIEPDLKEDLIDLLL